MGLAFDTRRGTEELLERDDALAVLAEALNEARLGFGRVVLIGGEAGAGKTSLVGAFCAGSAAHARARRSLRRALDAAPARASVRRGHGVRGARGPLGAGVQPSDVFAALRDELAGQPTVLVIEDLHWGDEATFDVLRLLAAGWTCRRSSSPPIARRP